MTNRDYDIKKFFVMSSYHKSNIFDKPIVGFDLCFVENYGKLESQCLFEGGQLLLSSYLGVVHTQC